MKGRFLPAWAWTPLVFVLDFFSKRIVLAQEEALRAKINILGELLRFSYVRNPGSAMGLFPVGRTVLVLVSILASFFLLWLYFTTESAQKVRRAAMAAILGGALGNLVDRLFYDGLVVDFIDIGIGTHRFYTFNVADMGVTLGGVVLFFSLLREGFGGDAEKEAAPAVAEAAAGTDSESARESDPESDPESAPEPGAPDVRD